MKRFLNFKNALLLAVVLASFSELTAQVHVSVGVNIPPPPRSVEQSACPGADYIWAEGYWTWDDYIRDYVWNPGYWQYVARPRASYYVRPSRPVYVDNREYHGYRKGDKHDRYRNHHR